MNEKDQLQETQYDFPYHFIPQVHEGAIVTNQHLQWAMMYLGYMQTVRDAVIESGVTSVLDVGCGDGRFAYELEQVDSSIRYHGIDISERALHFARGFTTRSTFAVFDIIEQPYPELYDAITYIETIEHIEPTRIKPMVANMAASLKPNGLLFLTTPTTNVPTHQKHYQHFTREMIEEYLGEHFTITSVRYLNVESVLTKTLARLLVNRLLIVQPAWWRRLIFELYQRYCLVGTEKTGSRIFVTARKQA